MGAGADNILATDSAPAPKGPDPVQAENSVAPRPKRSVAGVSRPINASGAANPKVPTAPPVDASPEAPRSIRTAFPSSPILTFAGETSPWTTPRACK